MKRYAELGSCFDCAERITALTARADAIVVEKYAQIDALTAGGSYDTAFYALSAFGAYGSEQIPAKHYAIGMHALEAGELSVARKAFVLAGSYSDAKNYVVYVEIRQDEEKLASSTNQDKVIAVAQRYAALGDYLDCVARAAAVTAQADAIVADKYAQVDAFIANGEYTNAEGILSRFGTYGGEQIPAKRYAIGVHALEAGNYTKATNVFRSLGNYADAKTRITYVAIRRDEANLAGSIDPDKVIAVANRYAALSDFFDCADRAAALTAQADAIVADKYAQVDALIAKGDYAAAETALYNFGTYGCEQVPAKRYAIGVHALEAGNYDKAMAVFRALATYSDARTRITYVDIRRDEAALAGSTDQDKVMGVARRYTSMGDYLDCAARAAALTAQADAIVADKYAQVDALTAEGKYTDAERILFYFGGYGNGQVTAKRYAIGMHALEAGNFDKATSVFNALGTYSDAKARATYVSIRREEAALGDTDSQDKIMTVASRYSTMGDVFDCAARAAALRARADAIVADKYAQVDKLIAEGNYASAERILKGFGVYGNEQVPEKKYALGMHALEAGNFDKAETVFKALVPYSDAGQRIAYVAVRRAEAALTDQSGEAEIIAVAERYAAMGDVFDCAARAAALRGRADANTAQRYEQVDALIAAGDYVGAWEVLNGFDSYGSEQTSARYYAVAELANAAGHKGLAVVAYRAAGSHADAAEKAIGLQKQLNALVAAGNHHSVAVRGDGTVMATGSNSNGQCNVTDWRNVIAVAAGAYHTVGLCEDGTVVVVGANKDGLNQVSEWTDIVAVAAGDTFTVGLCADGRVVATGEQQSAVSGWRNIVAIEAGDEFIVGLRADGTVVLSNGDSNIVKTVERWNGIVAIAAGFGHVVGLRADGSVVAAGDNQEEQCDVWGWRGIVAISASGGCTLGLCADGTVVAVGDSMYRKCDVRGWENIVAVSIGGYHSLGLRMDGSFVTSGMNEQGQCNLYIWRDVVDVAVGYAHTVGVRRDGTVVADGENYDKRCNVSDWTGVTAVAAGRYHTVALREDGTVVAAGSEIRGQCRVTGWENITAIAAGNEHTVGLQADGTVVATGDNSYRQCRVSEWKNVVAIAAGNQHTVALLTDGAVVATGENGSGQCDVGSWRDIVAISAGEYHTLGLRSDGTVVAVGSNINGQCSVFDWQGIVAIAAGSEFSVGLRADGTLVLCGKNADDLSSVLEWKDVVGIAAGTNNIAGIRRDGTVLVSGPNSSGMCNTFIWDLFDEEIPASREAE